MKIKQIFMKMKWLVLKANHFLWYNEINEKR